MGWSKPVWPFWPNPTQPGPNLTGLGLAHSLYRAFHGPRRVGPGLARPAYLKSLVWDMDL